MTQKGVTDNESGEEKATPSVFKPWKTIKLGTGLKTADDFREAFKHSGNKIGGWANDILDRPAFTAATNESEVDLYILTTAELTGKKEGGLTIEVFAGAKRLGFEKCPAEVGPQLCQQYPDQPRQKRLLIGMEPIAVPNGGLEVFSVECYNDVLWLNGHFGDPHYFWNSHSRWVFIRRRSASA